MMTEHGNAPNTAGRASLKIGLFTDNHVLPRRLIANTPAYRRYLAGSPKLLTESEAVARRALALIREAGAQVIFHIGDLTKDGEAASHQLMATLFQEWAAEDEDRRVLVIPGNHDVNNSEGNNYHTPTGEPESLPMFTPADFRAQYAALVYDRKDVRLFRDSHWYQDYLARVNVAYPKRPLAAQTYAHGDLSYVTRLALGESAGGVTVFGLDSNHYSPEVTDAHDESKETNGSLSAPQLSWFLDEAAKARQRGDLILVLSHHAILPHFYHQEVLMPAYLIANWDTPFGPYAESLALVSQDERLNGKTPKELFIENGVGAVFSGHSHVNNVVCFKDWQGQSLYDVTTAATIAYPSSLRWLTIAMDDPMTGYTLTSRVQDMDVVTYTNLEGQKETVTAFWRRGEQLRFDTAFVKGAGEYFFQLPAYQLDSYQLLRRRVYPEVAQADIPAALVDMLRAQLLKQHPLARAQKRVKPPVIGTWHITAYWSDDIQQHGGRHYAGRGVVIEVWKHKRRWRYFIARDTLIAWVDHLLQQVNVTVFNDLPQLQERLVALATRALQFPLVGVDLETLLNDLYLSFQYGDAIQSEALVAAIAALYGEPKQVVRDFGRHMAPVLDPLIQAVARGITYDQTLFPVLEPLTATHWSDRLIQRLVQRVERHLMGSNLYQTLTARHLGTVGDLLDAVLASDARTPPLTQALQESALVMNSLSNGANDRFPYAFAGDRAFTLTITPQLR